MYFLIALLTLVISCNTFAHTKVKKTIPANLSSLDVSPKTISFEFGDQIKLTKVTLQLDKQDAIDIDISEFASFETSFTITNPKQQKGIYQINWRGLSIDGHVMKGTFSFTVR